MMRLFSELTKNISQKRREQIERRKTEIRQQFSSEAVHRFIDGKIYKLTRDGWTEGQPRVDLDRLDSCDNIGSITSPMPSSGTPDDAQTWGSLGG